VSNTTFGNAEAISSSVEVASLGKGVKVEGKIYSAQDLQVEGEVAGTIELPNHKLTVGPHGRIKADIKVREMLVLGRVEGGVQAQEKVEVRSTAQFVGDIKAARIILEDGAYVKGSIDIVRTEASKQVTKSPILNVEPPHSRPSTAPNFQGTLPN
jgi:cytoskeletal protein CcmA (bactofilin family)